VASRVERIALNEAAFREGNERMHAWPERQDASPGERFVFLCECGDADCRGRIQLTRPEYEAVRADEMRFAVLVGHVFPDAERVLHEHDRYLVVEKHEDVRAILDETYGPRTREIS
jgi:hypothetical protein